MVLTITNLLIIIPFIILFSPSGYFSTKYSKQEVLKYSSYGVLAIALGITGVYAMMGSYINSFMIVFGMIFILSIQSAIFSPAKFSYIKETFGKDKLAIGNAYVQAITITSILFSLFVFSFLFENSLTFIPVIDASLYSNTLIFDEALAIKLGNDVAGVGIVLVVLAMIQVKLSQRLEKFSARNPNESFYFLKYLTLQYAKKTTSKIYSNEVLRLSVFGIALFFAVSQMLISALPTFIETRLNTNDTIIIQGLIALSGIGIAIGSFISGRMSKYYIEYGSLPIAVLGMAVATYGLLFSYTQFIIGSYILLFGIAGGMFVIPLFSLVQFNSKNEIGKIIAGQNFIENISEYYKMDDVPKLGTGKKDFKTAKKIIDEN